MNMMIQCSSNMGGSEGVGGNRRYFTFVACVVVRHVRQRRSMDTVTPHHDGVGYRWAYGAMGSHVAAYPNAFSFFCVQLTPPLPLSPRQLSKRREANEPATRAHESQFRIQFFFFPSFLSSSPFGHFPKKRFWLKRWW